MDSYGVANVEHWLMSFGHVILSFGCLVPPSMEDAFWRVLTRNQKTLSFSSHAPVYPRAFMPVLLVSNLPIILLPQP